MDSTATTHARRLGVRAAAAMVDGLSTDDGHIYGTLTVVSGLVGKGFAHSPRYEYTRRLGSHALLTQRGREIATARLDLDQQS